MNEEILNKVINLVNSTDELIKLRDEETVLLHRLKRAVIGDKLLKGIESKVINNSSELPENIRNILKEHNVKLGWPHDTTIKLFDNGVVEVLTSVKNVVTYVFVINDKVLFCPA